MLGLHGKVFLVIESYLIHKFSSFAEIVHSSD